MTHVAQNEWNWSRPSCAARRFGYEAEPPDARPPKPAWASNSDAGVPSSAQIRTLTRKDEPGYSFRAFLTSRAASPAQGGPTAPRNVRRFQLPARCRGGCGSPRQGRHSRLCHRGWLSQSPHPNPGPRGQPPSDPNWVDPEPQLDDRKLAKQGSRVFANSSDTSRSGATGRQTRRTWGNFRGDTRKRE